MFDLDQLAAEEQVPKFGFHISYRCIFALHGWLRTSTPCHYTTFVKVPCAAFCILLHLIFKVPAAAFFDSVSSRLHYLQFLLALSAAAGDYWRQRLSVFDEGISQVLQKQYYSHLAGHVACLVLLLVAPAALDVNILIHDKAWVKYARRNEWPWCPVMMTYSSSSSSPSYVAVSCHSTSFRPLLHYLGPFLLAVLS
jgi:hypothetical protein